jgi:hypothetical protein
MSRLSVYCTTPIYEADGKDVSSEKANLVVRSHWNRTGHTGLVVLRVDGINLRDGDRSIEFSVSTGDLTEALKRATGF